MNTLKDTIAQMVVWGTTPKLTMTSPNNTLKKQLVALYQHYLELSDFDEDLKEYPDPPEFNFESISNTIRSNFPQLGFYHSVTNPFDLENKEHSLEDANDDLSDVIKDLMEVQWRFENTSEADALWYFEFIMRNHTEQHLANLLKTIKDLEEE